MSQYGSPSGNWRGGGSRWGGGPGQPWWRVFAKGDNPMTWSVPIGVVSGIVVRVSLIYIVWMIVRLVSRKDIGWDFELWSLGSLFILVLLHEFGHCIACRMVGGEADEILMWMLGGLASCRPPHNWKASLITTIGGPAVNVLLLPLFGGTMLALGAPLSSLVFNPWGGGLGNAWGSAAGAMLSRGAPEWAVLGLFTFYLSNLSLLLFNLLLAFYPFDGGRIVQELLWRKHGYTRSMYIATGVGLGGAVVVGLFGLAVGSVSLILIALFGGYTCYQQRMQVKFMMAEGMVDEPWGSDDQSWRGFGGSGGRGASARDEKASQKRAEKLAKQQRAERERIASESAELDRILAKIKDKGMASLTGSEQAFLRRSTQKSRGS
ncbi:MAG TPA: site-2 protease family protein [Phycisphaerales bacterium]|nr:site-2 protease family protein [Phycisphaerales bacterium]